MHLRNGHGMFFSCYQPSLRHYWHLEEANPVTVCEASIKFTAKCHLFLQAPSFSKHMRISRWHLVCNPSNRFWLCCPNALPLCNFLLRCSTGNWKLLWDVTAPAGICSHFCSALIKRVHRCWVLPHPFGCFFFVCFFLQLHWKYNPRGKNTVETKSMHTLNFFS